MEKKRFIDTTDLLLIFDFCKSDFIFCYEIKKIWKFFFFFVKFETLTVCFNIQINHRHIIVKGWQLLSNFSLRGILFIKFINSILLSKYMLMIHYRLPDICNMIGQTSVYFLIFLPCKYQWKVHGKTTDELHTNDIRLHTSDIRMTYEWHTDDIRFEIQKKFTF